MIFNIINLNNSNQNLSLSQKVIRGGFWVLGLRVVNFTISLIKTFILAHILSPKDFGVMGVAMVAFSTLETFSQTGIQSALIQRKNNVEPYLNTAWTISVIRGFFLFLVLFNLSYYIAKFFSTPEAEKVIKTISFSFLISGLTNIGTVYFQKEMEFNKQFIFEFIAAFIDLIVVIPVAIVLKNVWALALSFVVSSIAKVIISYILCPYKPSIQLEILKARELFKYGKWVSVSAVVIYLIMQGDNIFVGKVFGAIMLGYYVMAYRIANLPATDITRVVSSVTFPAYSKIQDDKKAFKEGFKKILQVTSFIIMPIAGSIFILSKEIVIVILGEKWQQIIPIIQILCFFGMIRAINGIMGPVLLAAGKPQILSFISLIQLVIMAIIIYPFGIKWGICGVAWAVTIPNFIAFTIICLQITKLLHFSVIEFLRKVYFPVLITIITCFIVILGLIVSEFLYLRGITQLVLMEVLFFLSYFVLSFLFNKIFKYGLEDVLSLVLLKATLK